MQAPNDPDHGNAEDELELFNAAPFDFTSADCSPSPAQLVDEAPEKFKVKPRTSGASEELAAKLDQMREKIKQAHGNENDSEDDGLGKDDDEVELFTAAPLDLHSADGIASPVQVEDGAHADLNKHASDDDGFGEDDDEVELFSAALPESTSADCISSPGVNLECADPEKLKAADDSDDDGFGSDDDVELFNASVLESTESTEKPKPGQQGKRAATDLEEVGFGVEDAEDEVNLFSTGKKDDDEGMQDDESDDGFGDDDDDELFGDMDELDAFQDPEKAAGAAAAEPPSPSSRDGSLSKGAGSLFDNLQKTLKERSISIEHRRASDQWERELSTDVPADGPVAEQPSLSLRARSFSRGTGSLFNNLQQTIKDGTREFQRASQQGSGISRQHRRASDQWEMALTTQAIQAGEEVANWATRGRSFSREHRRASDQWERELSADVPADSQNAESTSLTSPTSKVSSLVGDVQEAAQRATQGRSISREHRRASDQWERELSADVPADSSTADPASSMSPTSKVSNFFGDAQEAAQRATQGRSISREHRRASDQWERELSADVPADYQNASPASPASTISKVNLLFGKVQPAAKRVAQQDRSISREHRRASDQWGRELSADVPVDCQNANPASPASTISKVNLLFGKVQPAAERAAQQDRSISREHRRASDQWGRELSADIPANSRTADLASPTSRANVVLGNVQDAARQAIQGRSISREHRRASDAWGRQLSERGAERQERSISREHRRASDQWERQVSADVPVDSYKTDPTSPTSKANKFFGNVQEAARLAGGQTARWADRVRNQWERRSDLDGDASRELLRGNMKAGALPDVIARKKTAEPVADKALTDIPTPHALGDVCKQRQEEATHDSNKEPSQWACERCTLINDAAATRCVTCEAEKPLSSEVIPITGNELANDKIKSPEFDDKKTQSALQELMQADMIASKQRHTPADVTSDSREGRSARQGSSSRSSAVKGVFGSLRKSAEAAKVLAAQKFSKPAKAQDSFEIPQPLVVQLHSGEHGVNLKSLNKDPTGWDIQGVQQSGI